MSGPGWEGGWEGGLGAAGAALLLLLIARTLLEVMRIDGRPEAGAMRRFYLRAALAAALAALGALALRAAGCDRAAFGAALGVAALLGVWKIVLIKRLDLHERAKPPARSSPFAGANGAGSPREPCG